VVNYCVYALYKSVFTLHYIRPTVCEREQSCPANNSFFTPLRVRYWLLWILICLRFQENRIKLVVGQHVT